jgi:hypothetical protein
MVAIMRGAGSGAKIGRLFRMALAFIDFRFERRHDLRDQLRFSGRNDGR